jgi:regulator of protease activity HflC (stomatin/prohibitin superfamily)
MAAIVQIAAAIVVLLGVVGKAAFYVLKEYERGVLFRLGRLVGVRGPGFQAIIPFVDKLVKVDQRVVTMDIPTQDVISKDNVTIKVNAVLYFRVLDPARAMVQVENYHLATNLLAQTTLRSVCGEVELDDLLSQREQINNRIQNIIDAHTEPWGIKVSMVELKHIDLPQEMQRAMARQAEAERERRGKIIQAEGEYQAAEKLTMAAKVMQESPVTLQLRYLETLRDIASENNSTTLFPIPIDIFEMFRKK